MKIYVYAQHSTVAGEVYLGDNAESTDDAILFDEGTAEGIVYQAVERLKRRNDNHPGGNGDSYDWKCCRNVLEYLNGPAVKFNEQTGVYDVAEEE